MADSPIGPFEMLQSLENSGQGDPSVGPSIIKGSQRPGLQARDPHHVNTTSDGLGHGETESSGPDVPPGFEGYFGGFGISNNDHR